MSGCQTPKRWHTKADAHPTRCLYLQTNEDKAPPHAALLIEADTREAAVRLPSRTLPTRCMQRPDNSTRGSTSMLRVGTMRDHSQQCMRGPACMPGIPCESRTIWQQASSEPAQPAQQAEALMLAATASAQHDRMPLHSSTLSFPVQVFPARPAVPRAHTKQGSATARLNRHSRRQNLTRFYEPAAQ